MVGIIACAIAGSVTYFGMDASINEFIMLVVTFAVRMLALRFDWYLRWLA